MDVGPSLVRGHKTNWGASAWRHDTSASFDVTNLKCHCGWVMNGAVLTWQVWIGEKHTSFVWPTCRRPSCPFWTPPHPPPDEVWQRQISDTNKHIRLILTWTNWNCSNRHWHSITFRLFICELLVCKRGHFFLKSPRVGHNSLILCYSWKYFHLISCFVVCPVIHMCSTNRYLELTKLARPPKQPVMNETWIYRTA